jgi:hypothetical protein
MKKILIIAIGCLMTVSLAFAGEPTAADQKWLEVVQKMVAEGNSSVSTPSKDRVTLLQDWASKKGYSVKVTQSEAGYRATITKQVAQKQR